MASEFLQAYASGKAPRKGNYPERMGSAVINCAAVFNDCCLFDIPRRRNHPTIVFAGAWHGYHAKRKHSAQIICSLIIATRTDGPIERGQVPQYLHHALHEGAVC